MTKLNHQTDTAKNQRMVYSCPVPISLLPYLEQKGIIFKVSGEISSISDVAMIELEVETGLSITAVIFAALDYEKGVRFSEIKRSHLKSVA